MGIDHGLAASLQGIDPKSGQSHEMDLPAVADPPVFLFVVPEAAEADGLGSAWQADRVRPFVEVHHRPDPSRGAGTGDDNVGLVAVMDGNRSLKATGDAAHE